MALIYGPDLVARNLTQESYQEGVGKRVFRIWHLFLYPGTYVDPLEIWVKYLVNVCVQGRPGLSQTSSTRDGKSQPPETV